MTAGRRYEEFGWHWERLYGQLLREGEAAHYRRLALRCGGPVAEPACGGGRLLAVLDDLAQPLYGWDLARPLLHIARRRVPRARLWQASLQAPALDRQVGLLALPLDALRLLRSTGEQRQFLAWAAARLLPGGLLAGDLTLPAAGLPAPLELPPVVQAGRSVTATVHWALEAEDLLEVTTFGSPGQVPVHCVDRYRQIDAGELQRLLRSSGWQLADWASDFAGTPYQSGAPRLVFTARPGGMPR
ncbi:MAG: hypothetical protein IT204_05185 [Fimbriimonadaceae bacterium]|nr:hypothetical protein [Fimbriimonadaceae bacterium]